jgi:hypothetical protein
MFISCPQKSATGPYYESNEFIPHLISHVFKLHFNIILSYFLYAFNVGDLCVFLICRAYYILPIYTVSVKN